MNKPGECQKCGTIFSATPGIAGLANAKCTVCGSTLGHPGTFVPAPNISELRPWMWFGMPLKLWIILFVALVVGGILLK